MDTALKKSWIEALRSGKYKQGQRALLRDDRYCCLGVLCDVLGFEKTEVSRGSGAGAQFTAPTGEVMEMSLGPFVLKKVGLAIKEEQFLMKLNDEERQNFDYIADYIQENL